MAEINMPSALQGEPKEEHMVGADVYPLRLSPAFAQMQNPTFTLPASSLQPSPLSSEGGSPTEPASTVAAATARHRPERINLDSVPASTSLFPTTPSTMDPPVDPPSPTTPLVLDQSFVFPARAPATPPASFTSQSSPTRASIPSVSYRRRDSAFISGGGSSSGLGLMSSSPTKGENSLPPPAAVSRKRGHAHRRSGAISSHDLSSIMKSPEDSARNTGSALATPSDGEVDEGSIHTTGNPSPLATLPLESPDLEISSDPIPASPPANPQVTQRVEFSDTVEYIPRPLSMVSSVTSSSISTIRPLHSLSGSVSSEQGTDNHSPSSTENGPVENIFGGLLSLAPQLPVVPLSPHGDHLVPLFAETEIDEQEPNDDTDIAGGAPRRASPLPPAHLGPEGEPLMSARDDGVLSDEESLPNSAVTGEAQGLLAREFQVTSAAATADNNSSTGDDVTTKKRLQKAKSLSGLDYQKPKMLELDSARGNGAFGGPSQAAATGLEDMATDVNFDEDNTFVIRSPQFDVPRSAPAQPSRDWGSEPSLSERDNGDQLDLDAVWDSVSTEQVLNNMDLPVERQRTQSAPVLPAMNDKFVLPRYTTVIAEEDETEEEQTVRASRKSPSPSSMTMEALADSVHPEDVAPRTSSLAAATMMDNLGLASDTFAPDSAANTGDIIGTDAIINPAIGFDLDVEIVDPADEPRFSVVTKSSDESTITPTDPLRNRPVPTALELGATRPGQFSAYGSLNPSPSPGHSYFDSPRLGTAHSVATERSGWSSDRRNHVEEAPSLTGSASTMNSNAVPSTPVVASREDAQRYHSVAEAVTERPTSAASARKRRSFGNILLGRSRSNLNVETRPGEDGEAGQGSNKKGNRVSRFFRNPFASKSKDKNQG